MPSPKSLLPPASPEHAKVPQLGLGANWQQFLLLVVVNAFVGGMVGIERTVVPLVAGQDFGIASKTAILSFIATFGLTKAVANLFAGRMGDRYGRKRILVTGWLVGLPVPILLMLAPSWGWIIFANVLLGINQGLCWSTTVIMKIDLVGPDRRGLAMGFNEAAGYVAVALAALASGYLAATYALRPQPFVLGLVFAVLGLLLSVFFVRESRGHAMYEAMLLQKTSTSEPEEHLQEPPPFAEIFWMTSWKNRSLFAVNAVGALLAGVLADLMGTSWAIGVIGGVTLLSGVAVGTVMRETLPSHHQARTESKDSRSRIREPHSGNDEGK